MQFAICNRAFQTALAAVVALSLFAAPAFSDDKPKPSTDQSLDELLNIPTAPKKPVEPTKPAAPADVAPPPDHDPSKPPEGITEGTHGGEPFERAISEMKDAAGRLDAQNPGIATQRAQETAIRLLDQLISTARKQQKSKSKSNSRQQDQGEQGNEQQSPAQAQAQAEKAKQASESNSRVTDQQKAEQARPNDTALSEKLAEWGNLPPRLRDQLLQGMDDRYSQVYREMTEKYYRRLAEQNR